MWWVGANFFCSYAVLVVTVGDGTYLLALVPEQHAIKFPQAK